MSARGETPAQRAVGVDGVEAVAPRVDDAVRSDGRTGIHVAAAGVRPDPDPLGKRLLVSSLWLLSTLAAGLPGPQDRAVSTPAGGRS